MNNKDVYIVTGENRFTVLKYSPTGRLLWVKPIGEAPKIPEVQARIAQKAEKVYDAPVEKGKILNSYQVAPGDGFRYMFGDIEGVLAHQKRIGKVDSFVVKYDSSGKALWARQFAFGKFENIDDLVVGKEGRVYLTGAVEDRQIGLVERIWTRYKEDMVVAGFTASGEKTWAKTLKIHANVAFSEPRIACDGKNGIFVAGAREYWNSKGIVLVKLDRQGKILWVKRQWVVDKMPFLLLWLIGCLLVWLYQMYHRKKMKSAPLKNE